MCQSRGTVGPGDWLLRDSDRREDGPETMPSRVSSSTGTTRQGLLSPRMESTFTPADRTLGYFYPRQKQRDQDSEKHLLLSEWTQTRGSSPAAQSGASRFQPGQHTVGPGNILLNVLSLTLHTSFKSIY